MFLLLNNIQTTIIYVKNPISLPYNLNLIYKILTHLYINKSQNLLKISKIKFKTHTKKLLIFNK